MVFAAYNPKLDVKLLRNQTQILYYKEYRPGVETYSYPGYMGALNAIQTDIEISKYHLSTITNGMFASKMISFFEGIPTEEEKREIEKGFKSKFTGSENAGNIVLNFGKDPAKRPQLDDLSSTELDKHFDILSKSVQTEIFCGHQVVSPMLFGIRVEGQLGGRSEIREAYEFLGSPRRHTSPYTRTGAYPPAYTPGLLSAQANRGLITRRVPGDTKPSGARRPVRQGPRRNRGQGSRRFAWGARG